ncbi:hypothetical protein RRG08_040297 [Elysia crispata]|uniref:Uncharacterized protein n=1 Tax=Elysia crispata TaxID=231223 RepID=A0AAE0Z3I5_9GAST|nr:hypothetical protein RRG08_040297 [Elysia crispata]
MCIDYVHSVLSSDVVARLTMQPTSRNCGIISKETDTLVKGFSCHQTSQAGVKRRQASREDDWLSLVNGGASENKREAPAELNYSCLASSPPIFPGALWDMLFFSPLIIVVGGVQLWFWAENR